MTELYPGCFRGTTEAGVTVLAEPMPGLRSVAVGLWIKAGGRDDPPGKEGLAHFLEHMTFKGTAQHSAAEIAQAIDLLGGHLNAATTQEYTFYYTEVLEEGLANALAIMDELVTAPLLAPADVARERAVVEEEIRSIEDSPEDVAFQLAQEVLWPGGHPLSQPVVGRRESVARLALDDLRDFFRARYRAGEMVLVVSGRVDPGRALALAQGLGAPPGDPPPTRTPPLPGGGLAVAERDVQQVHLVIGFPTVPVGSPDRYGIEVLNAILGGGVSSRLFQRVREEHGLAYAVFSTTSYFSDAGFLAIYAAADEGRLPRVVELLETEVEALRREPPPKDEVSRAVQRLTNAFLLSLDDPTGRAARLGTAAALGRTPASPDEVVRRLGAVTAEEVQELARKHLKLAGAAWAAVGPSEERLRKLLRPAVEVA
ncbi:MAG: insulinase family protein [Candidatus Bipolaricaulota bacterium]|nr:insulinase family protein [Candidatus Bipolaricaulota bacterium]